MLKLAYSNRSACFAYLGNWKKCLEEIERFEKIDSGIAVDPSLVERITQRKAKCLEKIEASKDRDDELNEDLRFAKELLTTLKNESKTIPGAEEFVGIRKDEVKGRWLYNRGDTPIEPGTLILVEKAYLQAPENGTSFQSENCSVCLKSLSGGGIPCPSCVFQLYCSETCANSDYAGTHLRYECKILPYLHELQLVVVTRMALDVLLKLGPIGFLALLRQPKEGKPSISGVNSGGVYDSLSYEAFNNLETNDKRLNTATLLKLSSFAIVATKILDLATDYFSSLQQIEPELDLNWVKDEFARLLYRNQVIAVKNHVNINRLSPGGLVVNDEGVLVATDDLGSGIFPLLTLLNHSCDANVTHTSLPDGRMAVVTLQYIAPEQEFLMSYGRQFSIPKGTRQADLLKQCSFKCVCTPCKYDWSVPAITRIAICPECRPTCDFDTKGMKALAEIKLKSEVGGILVCPKCLWRGSATDLNLKCVELEGRVVEVLNKLGGAGEELKKNFLELKNCVKFCDGRLMKPSKALMQTQMVMKAAVMQLSKKLWG